MARARTDELTLEVLTESALSAAELITNCMGAGWTLARLASEFRVKRSVVEWWFAIGKLPPPDWVGEMFDLADRGALACEVADHLGHPVTATRRILVSYRAGRRARDAAAWEFAQVHG